MDRRVLFTIVFLLTLISTLLVIVIGMLSNQKWLYTALYALGTMWIMGIVSQLLIKHLYFSVVRTVEIAKAEECAKKAAELEIDIDEVERIDQLMPSKADEEESMDQKQASRIKEIHTAEK